MSPFLAVSVLSVFKRGRLQLTQEQFDEAFEAITAFLEECNDERFRLKKADEE